MSHVIFFLAYLSTKSCLLFRMILKILSKQQMSKINCFKALGQVNSLRM